VGVYLFACQKYIELSPVSAGIVQDPADYSWPRYRANALGVSSKRLKPLDHYLQLGKSKPERYARYRELFQSHVEGELLQDIRDALNKGLVLGTERFKAEVELLTKRRVTPKRRGRSK